MKLDMKFIYQVSWLAVKIMIVLLLSNMGQTFFVYQNF
jgi:hypothetical protein